MQKKKKTQQITLNYILNIPFKSPKSFWNDMSCFSPSSASVPVLCLLLFLKKPKLVTGYCDPHPGAPRLSFHSWSGVSLTNCPMLAGELRSSSC